MSARFFFASYVSISKRATGSMRNESGSGACDLFVNVTWRSTWPPGFVFVGAAVSVTSSFPLRSTFSSTSGFASATSHSLFASTSSRFAMSNAVQTSFFGGGAGSAAAAGAPASSAAEVGRASSPGVSAGFFPPPHAAARRQRAIVSRCMLARSPG